MYMYVQTACLKSLQLSTSYPTSAADTHAQSLCLYTFSMAHVHCKFFNGTYTDNVQTMYRQSLQLSTSYPTPTAETHMLRKHFKVCVTLKHFSAPQQTLTSSSKSGNCLIITSDTQKRKDPP